MFFLFFFFFAGSRLVITDVLSIYGSLCCVLFIGRHQQRTHRKIIRKKNIKNMAKKIRNGIMREIMNLILVISAANLASWPLKLAV